MNQDHFNKYFKQHPHVDELYFTSDGMAFFKKGDANGHAKSLKDKKVIKKSRPKNLKETKPEESK